jgi:hypothetical protein
MAFVPQNPSIQTTWTSGAMSTTATDALVGCSLFSVGAIGIGTCLGLAPASIAGMTLAAGSGAGLIYAGQGLAKGQKLIK